MLNGFYDIPRGGRWRPYLGGGIGVGFVSADFSAAGDDDDTVFAYQVGAGIGYEITPSIIVALDYRFFGTTDPEFDAIITKVVAEYISHNIGLNLRFRL
jgi:opacity protein-like surface antigen